MTQHPYSALVQPGRIGTLELKNRMIMAPMGSNYAETDGSCAERIQSYYEARAKGGAGLLIMGVCSVAYPMGTGEPFQVGISRDDYIPGLAELVRRVHQQGAKIAMQLHHGGKTAVQDLVQGREIWVPSVPKPPALPTYMAAVTPQEIATFVGVTRNKPQYRVMSQADIEQMVTWFADAADRARRAGFDGLEIHAAHTYILAGFLSPYYNQREDAYGGSLENRSRLLLEVLAAVKARVGHDFPVWVRLDAEELHTPGGISLPDAIATARLCEAAGADAISVSAYAMLKSGSAFTEAPIPQEPGAFLSNAAAVRQAVGVPVITSGRLELDEAQRAVSQGQIDFVAMGRKLLADPELPIKIVENRAKDVRPCIYCYACVSEIFVNRRVKCAVNAQTGHEAVAALVPTEQPRHVMVIGGGPAGMEAARVAAERGHRVTLVERSNRLGGTLFFAALAYPENGRLMDYLVEQMQHPRIEVRLNTRADRALVESLRPDTVLVASGARRAAPQIPGADLRHVWSGDELRRLMTNDDAEPIVKRKLGLAERLMFKAGGVLGVSDSTRALQQLSRLWMPLGDRVVVVGGGLVGLELAEFLLARGRGVTVLEAGRHAGTELPIVRRWRVLETVRAHAPVHLGAQVQAITASEVQWLDSEGQAQSTAADSVILAVGAEPDERIALSLDGLGVPVMRLGDCSTLGFIEGAMHAGHRAGRSV